MTLRDKYKELEQSSMVLQDQYSALAQAIGLDLVGFWGDPIEKHKKILERAELNRAVCKKIAHIFD